MKLASSLRHAIGLVIGLVLLLCGAVSASAATILQFGTGNTLSLAPVVVDPAVAAANLAPGAGLTLNTGSTFNYNSWNTASASFSDAVAANDFWSWGFTVTDPTALVDLTDMDIRLDRSGTGPSNVEIRASVNAGPAVSVLAGVVSDLGTNFLNIDLSAIGTLAAGDVLSFTLAAWGATSAAGTFDLETITFPGGNDGLVIRGDVSVVPEPGTALLFGLGLAGLGSVRRKPRARG